MYRRIVVPLDGTPFGAYALPFALTIARRTGAVLELVHVHTPLVPEGHPEDLTPYQFMGVTAFEHDLDAEAARDEAAKLREMARALANEHHLTVTTRVLTGHVALALQRESDDQNADLVVMATHGRGGLQRARLGSVADDLVRHSDRPVLLIRPPTNVAAPAPPADPPFARVLIPLDGSAFSERVLDPVGELLWWLGAQVTLLQVLSPADTTSAPPAGRARPRVTAARAEALAYLDEVADRVSELVPDSKVRVVEARDPATGILQVADEEGADLIAMATHGRGGLKRVLLGSTGDRVVQETRHPVLLYRPPAEVSTGPARGQPFMAGVLPPM